MFLFGFGLGVKGYRTDNIYLFNKYLNGRRFANRRR